MSTPHRSHDDQDQDQMSRIVQERRAEGESEHVAGPTEASYTDNPTFASQEGTAVDPRNAEVDYVEEPGVGGVSGDAHTAQRPEADEQRG